MSGYYYRVTPEPEKAEVYGFKKVSQSELNDIVSRLAKPTYNTRVTSDDPDKVHNYRFVHLAPPPRTPPYCSRRFSTGSQSGQLGMNKRFTGHELQRMLRRIQRPTRAHQLSRKNYEFSEKSFISRSDMTSRPTTATERKKAFYQLSRPTTASRAKHATECHLCDDNDRELNKMLIPFEYPYAETIEALSADEEASIVSRVSSPTKASRGGSGVCYKTPPDYESLHKQSEQLPLVSGLQRSKTVTQIVNRLYYNQSNKKRRCYHHGYSTDATPISDFTTMAP